MRASVDSDICIGCTLCTQSCSLVFKMEGERAVTVNDPVPEGSHECAQRAAEECPVQAIALNP